MHKIIKIYTRPIFVYYSLILKITKIFPTLLPDRLILCAMFYFEIGMKLNLRHPKTFNEKLQWLKLYNRRPEYTTMVDKFAAKKYVADIIGEQYIIPTFGVWDSFDLIDFDKLPNQFVLKTTHDSGSVIICKDKTNFDKFQAREVLNKSLHHNFYLLGREWPYKNVPRRIIAEKYMEDKFGEFRDYKFFCFDGKVKALFIASNRFTKGEDTKFDFFDVHFNHLPFTNGHPNATLPITKPETFDKMKELSEVLSNGQPHLRVDFYEVNGKIYFGELTLFHWSGLVPFNPIEWDYRFGEWIKLPSVVR